MARSSRRVKSAAERALAPDWVYSGGSARARAARAAAGRLYRFQLRLARRLRRAGFTPALDRGLRVTGDE